MDVYMAAKPIITLLLGPPQMLLTVVGGNLAPPQVLRKSLGITVV